MKTYFFTLVLILGSIYSAFPCSSAIISGKATPDGRPLLWKHRDAREEENDLRFFNGEKYDFIGLCNTVDTTGTQVWMGANSSGFSIMNTNAYNLERGRYRGPMDQDGYLMKAALSQCGSVSDFEDYLRETKGKRGVLANFGVIDAKGGAAFFEVDPYAYKKFDANDPVVAPEGYLIRTNYAVSGKGARGSGYIRYKTLEQIFNKALQNESLSADFLLLEATRSLRHSLFDRDLYHCELPEDSGKTHYIMFRDYIVRGSSVSTMVVQGVKKGESPSLTTLWTIPGFQLSCVTVPVWVEAGKELPEVIQSSLAIPSLLSAYSLFLKKKCFPLPYREGGNYMDLAQVLNRKGDGIAQKIISQDREMISDARQLIEKWRKKGFRKEEALLFYKQIDERIKDIYKTEFGLTESGIERKKVQPRRSYW